MDKCIICESDLSTSTLLFESDNMPSTAQDIPTFEECKSEQGIKLKLYQCAKCGLVQFGCDPVDYYKDVIRAGGGTTTMMNLRKNQYKKFIDLCNLNGKKIIEIGAGKGEFLQAFEGFDVEVYGIENSKESVEYGKKQGLNLILGFAENENTKIEGAPYDAFTSFNFLEHQPNPNNMLSAIYNNLTEDGVGLITVPSFEYILKYDGFYELIRDHIAYYTFETLTFLLNKNGFDVIEKEIVNRDTLAVVVKKRKNTDVSNLVQSYERIRQEIIAYIDKFITQGKKVAIWGASHQGFTIAATLQLQSKISYIIDSAFFKQGKYSPASHIPIVSPEYYFENPVDAIIIIAPGYTDEIKEIIRQKYGNHVNVSTLKSNHLELI